MPRMTLVLLILAVAATLGLGGCGSGGDDYAGGARSAASTFVLPFLSEGAGESLTLGFKNVAGDDAPVYVNAYDNAGGNYGAANQMFTVPARGELRLALSTITGGATSGGSITVETRDVTMLDPVTGEPTPVATSGYVFPYLHRQQLGGSTEVDATPALVGHDDGVTIALTPASNRVQLLNQSFDQFAGGAVPQAVIFAINEFDAAGSQVGATLNQLVAANGAFDWFPTVTTGQVRVEPVGVFGPQRRNRFALATRENNLQTHVESRATEETIDHWPSLVNMGFEVAFGNDAAGNTHDFALVLSNPSARDESLTLQAVYRKGGVPVLTLPRGYSLGAGRTVYMRTTTRDSLGLRQGEDSWFEDLFGDVFLSTGFGEVTLYLQAPRSLDLSARHYDPAFGAFYQVLRSVPRTNRACIYDLPIQVTTASGTRNYISITNTTNGNLEVPVRAFTPMLGTEYILDPIVVPPFSRYDWSPDGMIFREEPTDTVGPAVPFLRFDLTPTTGALFRGRTEGRNAQGFFNYIAPTLVRD